ncbi:hypothetical protein HU200_000286 [Digitaria exilis]|uniref:F-box protein AT5G49610-like beta-propeller domain-containing protein n=1 Tax=Digitaria exilis TaxID=1010633 RepID=A0A835G2L6_9POAL|nr:hypothetical protein HU200_000286 [Digitaria exilis]
MAAAAISAVLGDDDLLREILLRLGFATTLAPELAGAIRLATSSVDAARFVIKDTSNGRLLVHGYKGHNHAVLDPLHPTRDAATLPHPEDLYFWAFLAGGDGGGVVSACVFFPWGKAMVKVARTLRAMQRVVFQHTVIDVPRTAAVVGVVHAPVQGKIYIATNCGDMLVLVLASMSLSVLQLPDKEAFDRQEDVTVLGADDNLEYVFLGLNRSKRFMSVHLRSWTEKVYDETVKSITFSNVKPFMMVWPPVFPAAKEENVLEE